MWSCYGWSIDDISFDNDNMSNNRSQEKYTELILMKYVPKYTRYILYGNRVWTIVITCLVIRTGSHLLGMYTKNESNK